MACRWDARARADPTWHAHVRTAREMVPPRRGPASNNIPGVRKIREPQAPHDPTHVTRNSHSASCSLPDQTAERSFCPANLLFVFSV